MADCFIDTNIFLYAAAEQEAPRDRGKRDVAIGLLKRGNFGVSAQIMQEFYTIISLFISRWWRRI